jgi:hypothetical protein
VHDGLGNHALYYEQLARTVIDELKNNSGEHTNMPALSMKQHIFI